MINCKYFYNWLGPFIGVSGVITIIIFIIEYPSGNNLVSAWVIWTALSVSFILPLLGLGVGLSIIDNIRLVIISNVFFLVGFFLSLIYYNKIWILFTDPVSASEHLYLTLPISSFCAGLLLISPKVLSKWLIMPVSLIVGSMQAITIKLTDPTLHDPLIIQLGFIIAIWIVLTTMLTTRSFYRSWFSIAIPIFGSWLLASAILYGGASIAMRYGIITPKTKDIKEKEVESSSNEDILIPDFTQEDSNNLDKKESKQ